MAFFKTDLKGQIRNTDLPKSNGIWALFEAIVNSIQALEGYPTEEAYIEIYAKRETMVDPNTGKLEQYDLYGQKTILPFESFEITDNGSGFTTENFDSFITAHSTLKIAKGCKGIGRFLWLKAFKKASIVSNYEEEGSWYCRAFDFDENFSPDENDYVSPSEIKERKTTIILEEFQKPYQKDVPKSLESLAGRIVEHCLTYFILSKCPRIVVKDDIDSIVLHDYYNTNIKDSLHRDNIELGGRTFTLYHLQMQKNVDAHKLHLCANDREVRPVALSGSIPNLNKKIRSAS